MDFLRNPAPAPDREGTGRRGDPLTLAPFRGGAVTCRETALIPAGGYSMIRNLRGRHPGFEKRKGYRKLHTTADGTNRVVTLYQFSKGRRTERHLFAQMSDGDILEAAAMPPAVTTGVFGSEVWSGAAGHTPASWSHVNDILVMSPANGTDQAQVYAGDDNYVAKFVVFDGTAAPPDIPTEGRDYSHEVTDGLSTTVAVLDSLDTYANHECAFAMCPVPATKLTLTVGKANGNAAALWLYYRKNDNTWAPCVNTDLVASGTYQWTASASGTSEYYLEASGGGDPGLTEPTSIVMNGAYADRGTAGSLAAGEWDWADNDSLGFDTVYVRLSDGTDPDTKADGYVQTGVQDGTSTSGVCLAQSGTLSWRTPSDEIPWYQYGRSGMWYQLRVSAQLDSEVEITSVTYGSSFGDILNIWDGVPPFAVEARFFDQSADTYALFATDTIEISGMTHSADDSADRLYFNSADELMGIYVDVGETPNTNTTATVAGVKVWTGTAFEAVSNLTDGTDGLTRSGWITWARKAAEPTQFQTSQYYSYWYYLHIGTADLSDDVIISIQTMPYFDISEAGRCVCNCAWKTRMCYAFDRYPNRVLVSAKDNPLVLNGPDFGVLRAGDGRMNQVNCILRFKNEIVAFQEEKGIEGGCVTLFEGHKPKNFGRLVLSTEVGTFNSQTAVTVDGVLTSTATEEKIKTLFFFLSRTGLCVSDGRTIMLVDDDIRNYFDPQRTECVRRGYEDRHFLFHDTADNVLRMGLVTGTPRATGTATSTTSNKLVDASADFVTAKVVAGDTVYNTTDDTEALVIAVDDLHTLSLDTDIMASGEGYEVYASTPNVFPVFDLTDKVFYFDEFADDMATMAAVEAGSGNLPVLQLGGGVADGTVYQLNYGDNDISAAIDAYAKLVLNFGGLIGLVREILLRCKAQTAGNITLTPYLNDIAGAGMTLSMTAAATGEATRRHRRSWNLKGHVIEIRIRNNAADQSMYLEDFGLKLITENAQ